MTADTLPSVDPKALGRMDALPGSLGKVTLCAVFSLGIAAYVSVRKWLAARSAEKGGSEEASKYGLRGKAKSSNTTNTSSGVAGRSAGAAAAHHGKVDDGSAGVDGGASQSPPQQPQLPPRNYFTIRASLHVKRHNAKLMEWYDEQLGIQLPFSPQVFELKQEERQAPLILLSFRTIREPTHRMAVTIEELYDTQTAAAYCEASLGRIADCARILNTSTTRIGSKDYPAADYCYLDASQTMVFVFSVFVVHERLALTLQYVAPTRVRSVMPTNFYDVIRFMTFTAPAPSPSYLLVSEPRLGLGYHLPLDFLVHEGLAESDGVEDRLFTSGGGGGGPLSMSDDRERGGHPRQPLQHTRGAGGLANTRGSYPARGAGTTGGGSSSSSGVGDYYAGTGEGDWVIPYATAMSRGGRRMGLITSYEPSIGSGGLGGAAQPGSSSGGGGGAAEFAAVGSSGFGVGGAASSSNSTTVDCGVPYAWRPYLEQQVCKAVQQLGLVLGPGRPDGGLSGPRVIFQAPNASDTSAYATSAQTLLMEPYPLSVVLNGNFSAGDDSREEDGDAVNVTAFSLFREVRIDVNSSYVTLVPDTLDAVVGARALGAAPGTRGVPPTTVKAYWSAFYVPVGTACVSFHFIASALRHTSTEFISFCASVMNSISLGNHYGQAVSVMYCNTRHDVLPFRLSLPPTGMATVEEPMLADPLCVVQSTHGVEKFAVTVRVFPLFTANTAGGAAGRRGSTPTAVGAGAKASTTPVTGSLDARPGAAPSLSSSAKPPPPLPMLRPAERRGTRQRSAMRQLQYMVRYYLAQFPGGVHIVSCTKTTVNSAPALLLCFRPTWYTANGADDDGGGAAGVNNWEEFAGGGGSSQGASSWADTREATLEDEVGQLNPFAQYFAPPPPPASYLWAQQPGHAASSPSAAQTPPVTAATMRKAAGGAAASPVGDVNGDDDGDLLYARGGGRDAGDSQRSQEELDNPLRVAVAVCCEGNVLLFQTTASEYTLGVAQQAVQTTATYVALIPRGS